MRTMVYRAQLTQINFIKSDETLVVLMSKLHNHFKLIPRGTFYRSMLKPFMPSVLKC